MGRLPFQLNEREKEKREEQKRKEKRKDRILEHCSSAMLPFPLLYSLGSAAIAPLLFGYHMVCLLDFLLLQEKSSVI